MLWGKDGSELDVNLRSRIDRTVGLLWGMLPDLCMSPLPSSVHVFGGCEGEAPRRGLASVPTGFPLALGDFFLHTGPAPGPAPELS